MIFRTITDEATGATKSIGLFGKSIDELKSIISSVKTNGIFNTFFNTSTIDEEVIDEYNKDIKKAIANNATMAEKQKIMESAINGTNEATARLIKSTKGAIVETKAFKEAQDQSTLSAKAGQVALKGLAIAGSMIASFLIVEVLGLIVNGIDELVHSAEHCKERVDELMSSYKSALDTANANAKTIEGLADRYGELSKGVNDLGENMSLSTDEFQEYNDIVNQIAEMSPTLVQGYTNEGNAILTLKGNVDELRKSYEDARIAAYNMLIASGKDKDGNDIIKDWNNLHKTNFFSSLFDFGKIDVGGKISNSKAVEVLQAISSMSKEDYWDARVATTDKLYEKLSDEQKLIHDNIKFINTNLDYAGAQSDEDYSMLQKEAKTLVQTYNSEIKSSLSNVKTIANAYLMTNEDYEKLDDQSKNVASILVNKLNEDIA